jgi:hypothetical protein
MEEKNKHKGLARQSCDIIFSLSLPVLGKLIGLRGIAWLLYM